MILATAGHVDHGKTSLIERLTGVDTDRLAEEKARGLTINLGFAYRPLPSGAVLGIVDVPGHERFVSNMLAGVGAIDCALLVVAADDGPMPQTREHVAILDLLNIGTGVVALTKVDRVDAARVRAAASAICEAVAGTFLESAEIFPVSSVTGEGIGELQRHLEGLADRLVARERRGHFRLAVDRCFTIQGAGLVVTGAAFSGELSGGSSVVVSPAGSDVRVRGIRALAQPAQSGHAGERIALNLSGAAASKDKIRRGDWIAAAPAHNPSCRLDARLRVLETEESAFRHNRPVHFHFGAQDVPARVAVLEGSAIAPGDSAFVRVILEHPTLAVHGDRFVLRDQSAQRTIAGGVVLDAFGPARGRARPARVEMLRALEAESPSAALGNLLALPEGVVDLQWFERLFNLRADESRAVHEQVRFVRAGTAAAPFAVAPERWRALREQTLQAVVRAQQANADCPGMSLAEIASKLPRRTVTPVLASVLVDFVRQGRLRSERQLYFVPGSREAIEARTGAMGDLIVAALREGGVPPPTIHEISVRTAIEPKLVIGFLNRASARGVVRRVGAKRFFLSETVGVLARQAEELDDASRGGGFKVADFRTRTGIGRRPSVELLEYFDRVGFTVRDGDQRRVVRPAAGVFGA